MKPPKIIGLQGTDRASVWIVSIACAFPDGSATGTISTSSYQACPVDLPHRAVERAQQRCDARRS
jgi:hypothetical protein